MEVDCILHGHPLTSCWAPPCHSAAPSAIAVGERHEPRRSLGLNSANMVVNRNLSLWMGKIGCLELLVPLQRKQKPAIQEAANLPKRVLELGSHFGIAHINSRNPRSLVVLFR